DRNRSHWSTSKTPSYTKSVSWQHHLRRELVGTALRDMLSSGKRGADFNPSGFADWWQNLQHSGQLKTLAEHLPKETMSGLYDVYKVARAIKNAKAHEISTGKLNEFVNRFNRVTAPYELAAKHILNRPGFPGECFICELRLPDHRFRWK
ncbi:hypothetical protein OSK40_24645, partial [Escherichia coli]|nr:hypothetical protein [Escherichia coli]